MAPGFVPFVFSTVKQKQHLVWTISTRTDFTGTGRFITSKYYKEQAALLRQRPKIAEIWEPVLEPLPPIKMPRRIDRSPTAILEALSSTVGRDPTAFHYKYMDDPYFLPANAMSKRIFALSKESGRKAARFMVNKYPDLFQRPISDPPIPAFLTSSLAGYQKPEKPTVDDLLERLRAGAHSAAMEVYRDLQVSDPSSISQEVRQEMLERMCWHNGEEAQDSDMFEETWFAFYLQKDSRKRWNAAGPAQEVFRSMTKTPEAYATMICAMAKYNNADGAYAMFEEMEQANMPIPSQVYAELIRGIPFLKDSIDSRWELNMAFLTKMNNDGVPPTLAVFNSVLELLWRSAGWKRARKMALAVLSEMRQLQIEPSLASYAFLLHIFCRERGPVSYILVDILRELKGQDLGMRDARDTLFMSAAMEVAAKHLQDAEVAKRVHELLNEGRNGQFLMDANREHVYYNNLFRGLISGGTVKEFFKFYDELVPMSYTPDQNIMMDIVEMLEFNDGVQYFPRMWSDAVIFNVAMKETFLEPFLQKVVTNSNDTLKSQFADIAEDVKTRMDRQQPDRRDTTPWTGPLLSSVMQLLIRDRRVEPACAVLLNYINNQHALVGFPSIEAITEVMDVLVAAKDSVRVKMCLKLASDLGFVEITEKTEDITQALELPKLEKEQWMRLFSSIDFNDPFRNVKKREPVAAAAM